MKESGDSHSSTPTLRPQSLSAAHFPGPAAPLSSDFQKSLCILKTNSCVGLKQQFSSFNGPRLPPEGLLRYMLGVIQNFWFCRSGVGPPKSAFLTSSQSMGGCWEPNFENHWPTQQPPPRVCSRATSWSLRPAPRSPQCLRSRLRG